jgi:hypothetical protein
MADRMGGQIWIGGKVPRALVPELCCLINNEGVSLEWGGGNFSPGSEDDLLEACNEDGVLWFCDDQARWGEFEELEPFLREHKLAFTRRTEPKYEYDGELVDFRPSVVDECVTIDGSGNPMIKASELNSVKNALERAWKTSGAPGASMPAVRGVLSATRTLLARVLPKEVPPLEPFEIVD